MNPIDLTGLVSEAEGLALAQLAAGVAPPANVVEIGSYTGKSTSFIAEASAVPVYAVDLWNLRLPNEKKKVRNKHEYEINFNSKQALSAFLERTAAYENLTWIRGESAQVAKAWTRPIGLLFIDGAHDYRSVLADYEGWAKHVASGGWLAMHDATKPGKGVCKVIEETVQPSGLWSDFRQVERLFIARRV